MAQLALHLPTSYLCFSSRTVSPLKRRMFPRTQQGAYRTYTQRMFFQLHKTGPLRRHYRLLVWPLGT